MKKVKFDKLWGLIRKKVSEVLIVSLVAMNLTHINTYAADHKFNFAAEIEIDETKIDDDMFYIPHKTIEAKEGEGKGKYVFKVKRKGSAENAAKVKVTMIDISAKYDRDYSIRVIDKILLKENVQNKSVSKNIDEYMRDSDYEEYNYSDAVIDGSVNSDNIMTEDEKNNYKMSNDEKDELTNNAKNILDEYGIDSDIKRIDDIGESFEEELEDDTEEDFETDEKETVEETEETKEKEEKEEKEITETDDIETVGGFTNSDE